ncbi:Cof-type HAD-IIB family hydrolase [Chitinophaga horti]|uniref:Cof-type HAD-IIB family hydrolase n=1 Tax=Chitinophaga horti TaxID=2920382 RepID=A0ABY6J5H6_9BACT|nr:HAD family hydrolase [Chitinophaga horti]UYQ94939.1 Cof-type HAD-IIB family hydrolase [Chitinophaga horti]
MIKLIVTDLDGTLLNDQHQVPERFWEIADRLFTNGVKFGIATGRPHFSITESFGAIMNDIYAISDNGSFIVHQQTEILTKPLPSDLVKQLVITARQVPGAWPVLCGKEQWYIETSDEALIEHIRIYHKQYTIVDDLTKVDEVILKMSVCDLAGAEQNTYPYFKHFENELQVATGGSIWLDVTRPDANKGEAVRMLQKLHGITPEETLVFGDFMNDYEMMKAATHSYAMKNAYPKIIEAANFVTEKDNNEAGVLEVIERLVFKETAAV